MASTQKNGFTAEELRRMSNVEIANAVKAKRIQAREAADFLLARATAKAARQTAKA
jgi:hypothetical protein